MDVVYQAIVEEILSKRIHSKQRLQYSVHVARVSEIGKSNRQQEGHARSVLEVPNTDKQAKIRCLLLSVLPVSSASLPRLLNLPFSVFGLLVQSDNTAASLIRQTDEGRSLGCAGLSGCWLVGFRLLKVHHVVIVTVSVFIF